jgi:SPP1 family predicted phage head-tail adaptor
MIGELNQRARILARTTTPDGGGGTTESWNAAATVWVRLEPVSGDEHFAGQALATHVSYRIAVRRNAAIVADRRVAIGTRTFRILDVLDAGPQAPSLSLLCEELP